MTTDSVSTIGNDASGGAVTNIAPGTRRSVHVGLLTACQDKPYVFGFATSMVGKAVNLDVIGSDEVDGPEMHSAANINFINLRANQRQSVSAPRRLSRLLSYYVRLIGYAARTQARIFHILWNNRFEYFDRTLLMSYYRMLGKQVVLTAHNVNQARRDNTDSLLNRLTLRIQYALANHIFVHTEKAKKELSEDFRVHERKISVIPFGINNAVPRTDLTPADAKRQLGIGPDEKTILYFGRIRPYKGIEHLLAAYEILASRRPDHRLIVAGEPKKGSEEYRDEIQRLIRENGGGNQIVSAFKFIPDADIEQYLKAADVLVLPYKEIFQSGVLFLAYSFGLPVVAANVGSFQDEIVEGRTGFLCDPGNATELANTIERYFASELYRDLNNHREDIREYAQARHSWDVVADRTLCVYEQLTQGHPS
jgi:glycosyltransferase involved in cell wall biosynthesis